MVCSRGQDQVGGNIFGHSLQYSALWTTFLNVFTSRLGKWWREDKYFFTKLGHHWKPWRKKIFTFQLFSAHKLRSNLIFLSFLVIFSPEVEVLFVFSGYLAEKIKKTFRHATKRSFTNILRPFTLLYRFRPWFVKTLIVSVCGVGIATDSRVQVL